MASKIYIGNVDYDENEKFVDYIERFEMFLECNQIENARKKAVFLSVIGPKLFSLLKNLCTPLSPKDKTYEELKKVLMNHLEPKPNVITERYKFGQRVQMPGESINAYLVELKKLSLYCNYGETLTEQIRDKFISGLGNEKIKQKLLNESDVTLERAYNIAVQMEKTDKDVEVMTSRVHRMGVTAGKRNEGRRIGTQANSGQSARTEGHSDTKYKDRCKCCGKGGHGKEKCWFKDRKCRICHKIGHLGAVCRYKKGKKPCNYMGNESIQDNVLEDIQNLFILNDTHVSPYKLNLKINTQNVMFEIDTGAAISVISKNLKDKYFSDCEMYKCNLKLRSYINNIITPVGYISVDILYNDTKVKAKLYVIENGGPPLIGRDILKKLNIKTLNLNTLCLENIKDTLVSKFPEVFSSELGTYKGEQVNLVLKQNVSPKYCKARPIPFSMKELVEEEINRLVDQGVLTPVKSSEWATPIVPVLKGNGKLRVCGDFKVTINQYLEDDKHPIPRIEDLFVNLNKGEKFSRVDLAHAYQQLMLTDEAKKLVCINTHLGLFQYNRLPFGVKVAPNIFQHVMDQLFAGRPGIAVFMDDVVITGKNDQEHYENLLFVFGKLKEMGLTVSVDKCVFLEDKINYLGYILSKDGLQPDPKKVEAIIHAPSPTNVTELKAFLGLVNYYMKFLPNVSTVLAPLYSLLKKDTKFIWNHKCKESFEIIKNMMVSTHILSHFDPSQDLYLACDASAYGVGAVLSQKKNGIEKPIAFMSRTLNDAEKKYSQIDKEALALIFGVTKFNQYLWGRKFTLITDSKPLVSIFGPKKGIPTMAASRLQRYALLLSGYDYNIIYVKSEHNNADALSRLPLERVDCIKNSEYSYFHFLKDNVNMPIDYNLIRKETSFDPVLKEVLNYVKEGWPNYLDDDNLKPYFLKREQLSVEQGILMYGYRVVIPNKFIPNMLQELHSTHLGIVKMKSIARSYFWWPSIDNDIELMANSCNSCLLERPNPHKVNLHVWDYPKNPWSRLHVDYLGPIHGKYYFVLECAHTKWIEVEEVTSTSASQVIKVLEKLFTTFGFPDLIVSDNGPPFHSMEFTTFLKNFGIKQSFSPPYNPQTNGLAESAVKIIKKCIKKAVYEKKNVNDCINSFLLTYRNCKHMTTGESPAYLMFKRNLKTKFDLLKPNIEKYVQHKQDIQKKYAGGSRVRELEIGKSVLVRDYRSNSNRWIEGIVCKKLGPVTYLIKLQNTSIIWKRHINQILDNNMNESYVDDTFETEVVLDNSVDSPQGSCSEPVVQEACEVQPSVETTESQPEQTTSSPQEAKSPQVVLRRSVRDRKKPERLNL